MTLHTYHGAEFWTPERLAASQAMRRYGRQWAACSESERWQLRGRVHALRGAGVPESVIAQHIHDTLNVMRPWRLTDTELVAALRARYRGRRRKVRAIHGSAG